MTAVEARKIIADNEETMRDGEPSGDHLAYELVKARGFLEGMKASEVLGLVEALEKTKNTMERWAKESVHGSKFNHESLAAHFERALLTYRKAVAE